MHDPGDRRSLSPGRTGEILRAFLRLGMTAFGGPVAHLGYMRREFVQRRAWLDEARFAQLVAICQFLPGPTSSQLGFAIGLLRGGWRGAVAAFAAFTLPSALLMFAFAMLGPRLDAGVGAAVVHGLKLVAVVMVAHALGGMARQLTPDLPRVLIACATCALAALHGAPWTPLAAIALGAALGAAICRPSPAVAAPALPVRHGLRTGLACLGLCLAGLVVALLWPAAGEATPAALAAAFYRAGALVFGGGHVVLPLLEQGLVDSGWLDGETFLAGYGAAQAVPGPMFSVAAFLGAEAVAGWPPVLGAALALAAVFAPGFLLLIAVLPAWRRLSRSRNSARALAGVNAAVVGLLAAAFHDPILTEGIGTAADLCIAVAGVLLLVARLSPLWVVAGCVAAATALQSL